MPKFTMPIGKSDFAKVRTAGDYYIDKTMLIEQITASGAEVTLFTRPRRFGKSLNMSMLQHFFDIREKSESLFDGLAISKNKTLCDNWMNQYPTILVSFKTVDATNFQDAVAQLKLVLADLFRSHIYLMADENVDEDDVNKFKRIKSETPQKSDMMDSLSLLTRLLYTHHGNKPVILLIDEYDVPMAKGDAHGYYGDIINIMRSMYNKALKDNPYIKFAVLTGCLRIAEESIFTGLNNPTINTIVETGYDECFGFTNEDMNKLLTDTGLLDKQPVFKEWYDGYIFGNREVYCPWDVLNYVDALQTDPNQPPMNYWANTSGNDVIKRFLKSNLNVNKDFETLLSGGYIEKRINPNITYDNLTQNYSSDKEFDPMKLETNLWSILYMTGYLTILPGSLPKMTSNDPKQVKGMYQVPFKLKLPNNEIKMLFEETVALWFREKTCRDSRDDLFKALWDGDATELANIISRYLRTTISFYDYSESFYHAFLAGLFSGIGDIGVTPNHRPGGIHIKSNREYGEGRADVVIENRVTHTAAVLEFKVAENITDVSSMCDVALSQIHDIGYAEALQEDEGYDLISYGVIFYKKRCFIKKG